VVAVMGVHFAAGLAVRSIAEHLGPQLLGAGVDVANARVSLSDGHILLGRISVADPTGGTKPWFTVDSCELEVATAPLLARQLIVPQARLRGVQWDGADAESGAESTAAASMARWFNDHAIETARSRLAKIDKRLDEPFLDRLESVRRTNEFCSRWPSEITALDERAARLVAQAEELETSIAAANENPLRNSQSLEGVSAKVCELREEFERLSADFDKLPPQLEEGRRAIIASRRQDEKFVRAKLQVESVDAQLLNAYLLRADVAPRLDGLFAWLHRLREIAPPDVSREATSKRGEEILFAGLQRQPSVLVRALELRGEARIFDRPVEFRGLVSNLTPTPAFQTEPMQIRLSANEDALFELHATIDRTRGHVCDELSIECRELPLGNRSLGCAEQLQLKMVPSNGSLIVAMRAEGDEISGEVEIVQQQVRMTPAFAGQGDTLAIGQPLEQSLARIGAVTTRITLGGTVEQPTCALSSNLGPAVAEALEQGLRSRAEAQAGIVLNDARRHVDERLADLERQLAEHREKFLTRLANVTQRIETIASSQTSRERMSVEQAGRRLPTTSILR
jgi:uncharacterized protein (TIGR03545 family)